MSLGTPITDLHKEDFKVFEDGVEQPITNFSQEDAPLSIGLLFDISGSMRNKIKKATEAAAAFFKTSNPQDEFFLIEFSDRPKLTVPFTSDPDEVYDRIAHTKPFGRTSLLDAIHMAMGEMKHARNTRKALIIVSDGGDNRSRHTEREIKNAMLESDLQVYAMGIFDPEDATQAFARRTKRSQASGGAGRRERRPRISGNQPERSAFHQRPDRRSTSQSISIRLLAAQVRARWKVPEYQR